MGDATASVQLTTPAANSVGQFEANQPISSKMKQQLQETQDDREANNNASKRVNLDEKNDSKQETATSVAGYAHKEHEDLLIVDNNNLKKISIKEESQIVEHRAHDTSNIVKKIDEHELKLLLKDTQEYKIKMRKLQMEIDEKNEIINVLKDELELSKDKLDKFEKNNLLLLKDSKRVKFLQDELDFLQEKIGNSDKLELELKKLKEKLNELDYLKLRVSELEDDKAKALLELEQYETKIDKLQIELKRMVNLESEVNKWKTFSQELELERNSFHSRLLESIEQEEKLNSTNKQVEDEVKRLRLLIKSLEEKHDEEQASNSLIMSVADLENLDRSELKIEQSEYNQNNGNIVKKKIGSINGDQQAAQSDNALSIKFELDKHREEETEAENRKLKQQLFEQEHKFDELSEANQSIRDELESNKKLISDLRQDLACEKNLALKLTNQLTNFTKQIKHLDKHYFPIHDQTSIVTNMSIDGTNQTHRKNSAVTNSELDITDRNRENKSSQSQTTTTLIRLESKQIRLINDECSEVDTDAKEKNSDCSLGDSSTNETKQHASNKLSSNKNIPYIPSTAVLIDKKNLANDSEQNSNNNQSVIAETKGTVEKSLVAVDKNEKILRTDNQKAETRRPDSAQKSKPAVASNDYKHIRTKARLLSTAANSAADGFNNNKLANYLAEEKLPLEGIDRLDSLKTSLQQKHPSNITSDNEEELKAKQQNSVCKSNGVIQQRHLISVSPSSNACSQDSSPSAALTVGHDSGFQSINNDFNQVSPSSSSTSNATTAATPATGLELATSIGPEKSNQSTLLRNKLESAYNLEESLNRKLSVETPTRFQDGAGKDCELIIRTNEGSSDPISNQNADRSHNQVKENNPERRQRQQRAEVAPTEAAVANSSPTTGCSGNNTAKVAPTSTSQTTTAIPSTPVVSAVNLLNRSEDESIQSEKNINGKARKNAEPDAEDECDNAIIQIRAPVKSSPASSFVRNSLPSRSINYRNLKSSTYLDRIRATVTATTTTNSATSSSFINEQQQPKSSRNVDQQQPSYNQSILNCMLDHKHSERCFLIQNRANMNQMGQHQQWQSKATTLSDTCSPIQSSRQLNALIDPAISNDHFSAMAQQHHQHQVHHQAMRQNGSLQRNQQHHPNSGQNLHHHHHPYLPFDGADLNEQQIAHLASLHQQHYYHHLQHMHQLHQLHHHHQQHHLRMQELQQMQQQQQREQRQSGGSNSIVAQQQSNSYGNREVRGVNAISKHQAPLNGELIYSGGSQFYAPEAVAQVEQVYANTIAKNSNNNDINQVPNQKLVSGREATSHEAAAANSGQPASHRNHSLQQQQLHLHCPSPRSSPVKAADHHQQHKVAAHHACLPQIGEFNGLPTVHEQQQQASKNCERLMPTSSTHRAGKVVRNSSGTNLNLGNSNNSSASSSPTSSASSNLSTSSSSSSSAASSSAASLNSTSGLPLLSRHVPLRHTTTDLNRQRRQFSIERELVGPTPKTATLSRVGSCRQSPIDRQQSSQLMTSVKSSSRFVATSIIDRQSTTNNNGEAPNDLIKQRRMSSEAMKLSNNLANIRLNDSLAFASLRAPKARSAIITESLNKSLQLQHQQSSTSSAKPTSASAEKVRRVSTDSKTKEQQKSSVWFEYGCV